MMTASNLNDGYGDSLLLQATPEFDKACLCFAKSSLMRTRSKKRALAVGSGPVNVTREFVEEVLEHSNEIIIVEPSTAYCNAYKREDWYVKNQPKIQVICDTLENVMKGDALKPGSFDLIWCSHVVYGWRKDDHADIIHFLVNLLVPDIGMAVFIHGNFEDDYMRKQKKKLCSQYNTTENFYEVLQKSEITFNRFKGISRKTSSNARAFMRVVFEMNVLRVSDYRLDFAGPLSQDEERRLDEIVEETCAKIVKKGEDGLYRFDTLLDCYVLMK